MEKIAIKRQYGNELKLRNYPRGILNRFSFGDK